jgi:hypothetical protein
MERIIPNLNKSILGPLLGHKEKSRTEEKYLKEIQKFERESEKSLRDLFGKLSIDSLVKTDPYSLPYNNEVLVTLRGESYMNGPYEFHRVARQIAKEVLDKNLWKFRFYMFINVVTPDAGDNIKDNFINHFGRIEYRFRYYIHPEQD